MFEKLKKIRKETNTPIKSLTKLLELETDSAYLKKEAGERKFSLQEALKLATFFGKTVEELFSTSELSKMDNK